MADWNFRALMKKAEIKRKSRKFETAIFYEDLAFCYDLGIVEVVWESGHPKLIFKNSELTGADVV